MPPLPTACLLLLASASHAATLQVQCANGITVQAEVEATAREAHFGESAPGGQPLLLGTLRIHNPGQQAVRISTAQLQLQGALGSASNRARAQSPASMLIDAAGQTLAPGKTEQLPVYWALQAPVGTPLGNTQLQCVAQ